MSLKLVLLGQKNLLNNNNGNTSHILKDSPLICIFPHQPPLLDKKDEIWCYILIKLFTTILEDPEEAERLLKPTKSAFDIDLQPAVEQLKAAIRKKKSEQAYDALRHFSSTLTSPKKGDQAAKKTNSKYQSSSSSSTISSSSGSSDDETYITPQTEPASHSMWTQRNVGDSFGQLSSSPSRNDNNIKMEDVLKFVSALKSGKY